MTTSARSGVDILIVEDSPTQAHRLEHILVEQGFRVRHAANGRAALDMVRERKPDMVISDVIMPEMDGYDLCSSIKADPALAEIPVILVTTLSDPADVIRGLECRADNFILKPYDDKYLVNRVHYILLNREVHSTDRGELAVKIYFNGRRHLITADRMQILNLLLSTYEAAIQRNKELTRSKEALAERGAALAQRQRELDATNSFLENLIAASPSIIYRFEPGEDLLVTYASPNVGSILGYSVREVVGVPHFWIDTIHPEERDGARLAVRRALAETTAHIEREYRMRTKEGTYRWFLTTMRIEYDEHARPTGILCHSLDINDRKQAEEETRRAESFLNSIVENVPSTIFVKDAGTLRYVRLNRAFEELMGLSRGQTLGMADTELFPPEEAERFLASDREALERQELVDVPASLVHTGHRGVRLLHTRKIPILGSDGRPQYLLGISDDITEAKASEQALAAAKLEAERANRAKSEFLSRMSHELRTPLNAVLGFAQLLEADGLGAEQQDSVRHILTGGAHLLELINEVLDIARIEAGHLSLSPEPVPVGDVVGQAVELVRPLARQRAIEIEVRGPGAGAPLYAVADRQRLNQVLLNLLSNAVKYNRERGKVDVTVHSADHRVQISVTDTGSGIPPAKLPLLFHPFERLGADQRGIEGTGLGLALSKALVEAMNGALGVESEIDRGSRFWVELPASEAPTESAARPPAAVGVPLRPNSAVTGTVLYIEDNTSNWRLMQRVLARRPGVRLVGVAQGQAGLDVARAEPPDLILLDLHLPDMHGEEVLRLLWEDQRTRSVPVAVLSADAMPSQAKRLLAGGASAYLTKPIDVQHLLAFVDEALAKRGVPHEPHE